MKQKRNIKGQFEVTSGNKKYNQCQKNGIRKQKHVLIWEQYYNKQVPKGYLIHHIDENKLNNSIDNLKCVSYKEHNNIHKHPAWNKGIKTPEISKAMMGHNVSNKQIQKDKLTWFLKFLDSNIKIWKLRDEGRTWDEISNELNLTKGQVVARWRGFCKIYLIPFEEVKNE
jgi:hypothetical protein